MSGRRRLRSFVGLVLVAFVAAAVVDLDRDIAAADLVLTAVQPGGSARFQPGRPGTIFVLVVGSDERPGLGGARGDGLHVIGLNPGLGRATLLNIPRDTYVDIPGHGRGRVNEAYNYGGPQLQAQTVQALTGAPIRYVLTTTFVGLVAMVDALGGLEVDVPYPMHNPKAGTDFSPGRQSLGGAHVLAFARDRDTPAGDFDRTANQGQLIIHALESLRRKGASGADVVRYLDVLFRNVRTEGVSATELYQLARAGLALDPGAVRNVTLPGRTGQVGASSVVFIRQPEAGGLFADFVDDAVLQTH